MFISILGIVNIILEIHDAELWHGIKYYAEARVLIATISVWLFGVRHTNISFLLFHVPMVLYVRIAMMI